MALNVVKKDLFNTEWVAGLRGVPEAGMKASVEIFLPGTPVYNPSTNDYTSVKSVAYEGKARVQPLRAPGKRDTPANTTWVLAVLVSIPVDALSTDLVVGAHQMAITKSPLNADLLRYRFILNDAVDSSNPLERTLYFTLNQEVRK